MKCIAIFQIEEVLFWLINYFVSREGELLHPQTTNLNLIRIQTVTHSNGIPEGIHMYFEKVDFEKKQQTKKSCNITPLAKNSYSRHHYFSKRPKIF